ncbi:MAG: GH108, partial [uncultured Microvirga sp.]
GRSIFRAGAFARPASRGWVCRPPSGSRRRHQSRHHTRHPGAGAGPSGHQGRCQRADAGGGGRDLSPVLLGCGAGRRARARNRPPAVRPCGQFRPGPGDKNPAAGSSHGGGRRGRAGDSRRAGLRLSRGRDRGGHPRTPPLPAAPADLDDVRARLAPTRRGGRAGSPRAARRRPSARHRGARRLPPPTHERTQHDRAQIRFREQDRMGQRHRPRLHGAGDDRRRHRRHRCRPFRRGRSATRRRGELHRLDRVPDHGLEAACRV